MLALDAMLFPGEGKDVFWGRGKILRMLLLSWSSQCSSDQEHQWVERENTQTTSLRSLCFYK